MVTRRKTLQETSLDAKNANLDGAVRQNLSLYSQSEIDAKISLVTTDVTSISGDVATNVSDISSLEVDVATISGDVATLFNITTTVATSGAQTLPAGPEGFITISVNGVDKKIPYYGV